MCRGILSGGVAVCAHLQCGILHGRADRIRGDPEVLPQVSTAPHLTVPSAKTISVIKGVLIPLKSECFVLVPPPGVTIPATHAQAQGRGTAAPV